MPRPKGLSKTGGRTAGTPNKLPSAAAPLRSVHRELDSITREQGLPAVQDIAVMARAEGPASILALVRLRDDLTQPGAVQKGAADSLLDRAYGRPHQSITQQNEGMPQFAIVVPQRTSSETEWLQLAAAAGDILSPNKTN